MCTRGGKGIVTTPFATDRRWLFCASRIYATNLTAFNSWMFEVVGVTMQGGESGVRVVTSSTL